MMNGRTNSGGNSTESMQIPLDAPSNVVAVAGVNSVSITWTDPKDKYGTTEGEIAQDPQQLVSVWDHSVVVRKVGSNPAGPLDGTVVCSSTTRNQYQSTGFVDMGLEINQTYYYGVFAYNESGVASEGSFSNCHLWGFDSILDNNSWEQISQAGSIGMAPSVWEIGDEKNIEVLNEPITLVITDFNHDDLADGSGKAPISFGMKELMKSTMIWGGPYSNRYYDYLESNPHNYITDTVFPALPSDLQSVIKEVNKDYGIKATDIIYSDGTHAGHIDAVPEIVAVKISLFTIVEVTGANDDNTNTGNPPDTVNGYCSGAGTQYPYFTTKARWCKHLSNGTGAATGWYLASNDVNNTRHYGMYMNEAGEYVYVSGSKAYGICFQFAV